MQGPKIYPAGTRLASYVVVEEIARGGQGVVLKARDPSGRFVAVKVLVDGAVAGRFLREARTLAKLSHPNLVAVREQGELPPHATPYLVMDYIEGEDLRARLARRGVPPLTWAVETMSVVAETLAYCHERGVIHRDVKPHNIVIEAESGRPVLVDFGLLKRDAPGELSLADPNSLTQAGEMLGTPAYMSPEQIGAQEFGPVTVKSDVYGLGATLFQVLTGEPPFRGSSVHGTLLSVLKRDPPDPRSLRPELPEELAALCLRCLRKAPAERPASANEVARALRAARATPNPSRALPVLALLGAGLLGGALAIASAGGAASRDQAVEPPAAPTAASPAGDPEAEARAHLDRARELLDSDPAAAVETCRRALELAPKLPEAWLLSARARAACRDLDGAQREATRAIELEPLLATAWAVRASVREALGESHGALDDADRALELAPELVRAWDVRSRARAALGDTAEALRDVNRALELDPQSPRALSNRAALRFRLGDYEGGLEDAEAALGLDPESALTWNNRAVLRAALGDPVGALQDTTRALELDPDLTAAYVTRAAAYQHVGNLTAARRDLEAALELEPNNASALVANARYQLIHGEPGQAMPHCNRLLQLYPNHYDGLVCRAAVRIHLGDKTGALQDCQHAIERHPQRAEAYLNRAQALSGLGRVEEAIEAVERALILGPPPHFERSARDLLARLRARN